MLQPVQLILMHFAAQLLETDYYMEPEREAT